MTFCVPSSYEKHAIQAFAGVQVDVGLCETDVSAEVFLFLPELIMCDGWQSQPTAALLGPVSPAAVLSTRLVSNVFLIAELRGFLDAVRTIESREFSDLADLHEGARSCPQ